MYKSIANISFWGASLGTQGARGFEASGNEGCQSEMINN